MVASTASVRQAFDSQEDGKIKSFTPQLSIPVPRVSQVAFSSDESFLVICAESGGGLAIYELGAIMQGSRQPSSQIGTNGIAVRALVPNPAADFAYFFSIVTSVGTLMLAHLTEKRLISGPQGPAIREGVSCVSWSKKGKQLVAGLGDGTAVQMTHDGTVKAEIPRPPNLEGDQHGKCPNSRLFLPLNDCSSLCYIMAFEQRVSDRVYPNLIGIRESTGFNVSACDEATGPFKFCLSKVS